MSEITNEVKQHKKQLRNAQRKQSRDNVKKRNQKVMVSDNLTTNVLLMYY
jgi:hypothetical protein